MAGYPPGDQLANSARSSRRPRQTTSFNAAQSEGTNTDRAVDPVVASRRSTYWCEPVTHRNGEPAVYWPCSEMGRGDEAQHKIDSWREIPQGDALGVRVEPDW